MRTRDEILTDLHQALDSNDPARGLGMMTAVQFELLADIRDLLMGLRTVSISTAFDAENILQAIQNAQRPGRE